MSQCKRYILYGISSIVDDYLNIEIISINTILNILEIHLEKHSVEIDTSIKEFLNSELEDLYV